MEIYTIKFISLLGKKIPVTRTARTASTHWHSLSHGLTRVCVHTSIQVRRVKTAPKGNSETYRKG